MRVLLLTDRIPPENRGGAGEIVWRLAVGLQAAGHAVTVACATSEQSFEGVREGIPTIHLHSQYAPRWRAWRSLRNPQTTQPFAALLERLRPQVVHAHNIHSDLSYHTLTQAHQQGIRTVFTSHDVMPFAYTKLARIAVSGVDQVPPGGYRVPWSYNLRQNRLRYNPWRNRTIRHILTRHTDVRVAVSAALARAHQENDLPPFTVLHNAIDPTQWQATAAEIAAFQAQRGIKDRRIVLFGGRLTNAKGTLQLLDALEDVIRDVPDILLLVLSAVPLAQQIAPERLARLQGHIQSAGWLSGAALVQAYHSARVVVVPSVIFDSFPTMILEAMACARPVIATCFGGGREAVVSGETGVILNPFDRAAFAAALRDVLTDDALALRYGQAGAARVRTHFGMQAWLEDTMRLYSSSTPS